MVSKKTSDNDVKKVSTATTSDTAKKSSRTSKKIVTATTASKAADKKAVSAATHEAAAVKSVKKVTPAPKKAAVKTNNVPVKENKVAVSPASEVKKTTKTVKAKATVVNSGISAGKNSGEKAAMLRNKRGALKENVQKAEAKKFMDMKDNTVLEQEACGGQCCFISGAKTFFRAWVDGYRKMFNYKSRTNRYDFWAFMLLNFVLVSLITFPYQLMDIFALTSRWTLPPVINYAYLGFSLIVTLAYLSLFVRRLHDAGYNGWKGFFGPMTYSILGIVALIIVGHLVFQEDKISEQRADLFELGLMVLLLINLYYIFKTFIAASFMEEDAENAYGLPKLLSDCDKKKVLRYAALYVVVSVLYMAVILGLHFYYFTMLYVNGGIY